MSKIIHSIDFIDYIEKLKLSFRINSEIKPNIDESEFEPATKIKLKELPDNTFILISGESPYFGDDYFINLIRKNKDSVDIWQKENINGLNCPLESIVSWEGSKKGILVNEAEINLTQHSLMPRFRYDDEKRLLLPDDINKDAYSLMKIHLP
jgi:hypothetical protein